MIRKTVAACLIGALVFLPASARQSSTADTNVGRVIGEVFANGRHMKYLSLLADDIGQRLTGSAGARRAEREMEAEMKRIGLVNVRREPFEMPSSWERGTAQATIISHDNRPLTVASFTWTPGTDGAVEGDAVDVGAGRPDDVARVRSRLKGAVAIASPAGVTLDEVIYNFYRTPLLAKEVKEAGAVALLIASDKQNTLLYTAPIDFTASPRLAALPALNVAREDAILLARLLGQNRTVRIRLDVKNKLGPAFESTNIVGEIRGADRAGEIVVVGAHLDSNDLGPGALDNAAGCGAVLEAARAILALVRAPRRTIRFVLFMGEEEGMIGSIAYVRRHRDEMDRTVAALIMDIGAGRPLGWFSMGRTDLDGEIRQLMKPLDQFGVSAIEHSAFAATDNAPFMAEGVPNLILLQDDSSYFPVHHTAADTFDKANPRDYSTAVATLAATTFMIADSPKRFGRRLTRDEVKKMAADTKVDEQWRAAGIWP
ncbi:MAG TPA: M20/M25/M40 family metallo-hydrolase [Blastocatellia bacterium]|nr:M20/M25/M40 family metallo-hydrolase [Blastocatellia bacterium]